MSQNSLNSHCHDGSYNREDSECEPDVYPGQPRIKLDIVHYRLGEERNLKARTIDVGVAKVLAVARNENFNFWTVSNVIYSSGNLKLMGRMMPVAKIMTTAQMKMRQRWNRTWSTASGLPPNSFSKSARPPRKKVQAALQKEGRHLPLPVPDWFGSSGLAAGLPMPLMVLPSHFQMPKKRAKIAAPMQKKATTFSTMEAVTTSWPAMTSECMTIIPTGSAWYFEQVSVVALANSSHTLMAESNVTNRWISSTIVKLK